MTRNERPVASTYCGDPAAKFTVSSVSSEDGTGIQGYYTNEFAAHLVAQWCKKRGHSRVVVEPYNKDAGFRWPTNVHPYLEDMLV